MAERVEIEHQSAKQRFTLGVGDSEAELTYTLEGDTITFDHTEVPAEIQHQGYADQLARAALGFAREENYRVVPECRFMEVFIQRHKEFQDLLKQPTGSQTPRPMAGGTR